MRITIFKTAATAAVGLMLAAGAASAQELPPQFVPPPIAPGPSAPAAKSSAATPRIPSWVRLGLTVNYVAYSAFVKDGQYVDPIELTVASRITSASAQVASGTTQTHTVGTLLGSTYTWSCSDLGICRGLDWQFWVDPNNPTASITGPDGERFSIVASGRYTDPWKRTWNATLLNYQSDNGVRFTVAFDRSSGLILYNVESYPTEYIVQFYYS